MTLISKVGVYKIKNKMRGVGHIKYINTFALQQRSLTKTPPYVQIHHGLETIPSTLNFYATIFFKPSRYHFGLTINNRMKPFTYCGRNYTQFWAWWPVTTSQGQRIWMTRYYIRPGPNGVGLVLSHWDMLADALEK